MFKLQTDLQRERGTENDGKVAFVELFFDLIFVFSIIQLSHTLANHFTPQGILETGILILCVWWIWIFTTWFTNFFDPEKYTIRILLCILMLACLFLATFIPEAFADKGLYFALAVVFIQVGRSCFATWALREHNQTLYRGFLRLTIWLAFASIFWIAGGYTHQQMRLIFWMIALVIEYLGPMAYFWVPGLSRSSTLDWNISGAHLAERTGLFVIICLGETILVSGRTFSELPLSITTATAFTCAFIITVTMWWIYFHIGHECASKHIEASDDPGRIGRMAFTYAHVPIISGILLDAVATEFILAHPTGDIDDKTAIAILGGPTLFLLGNIWFKGVTWGRPPLSHMLGLLIIGMLIFTVPLLSPLTLEIEVMLTMIFVASWEHISLKPGKKVLGNSI